MALGRARQPRFPDEPSFQGLQEGALTIEQMANQSDRQQQDLYENELRLADEDKQREDGAYFQQLFEENGGDLDKSWDAMVRRNAPLAYQMRDMDTKSRMEAGQQATQALTHRIAEARSASTTLSANPELYQEDPAAWQAAVSELPARFQENAPPEFDQAYVDNIMNLTESEADEASRSQANITGILEGAPITHSRRELGRADSEEEWNDTIQVLLSLKGMSKDALRQAIGSMSLDYPGPERVKEIYDSGFTMDELGAQERNDANNAQRDEELEIRRGELELKREEFERGEEGSSLRGLIQAGEPGHAAWQLQWARWGKEYGEAGPPIDVIEAAHAEIMEGVKDQPSSDLDPVAVRGANATYATESEPMPVDPETGQPDTSSDDYRDWYEGDQDLRRQRRIAAGEGTGAAAPAPTGPTPVPEERISAWADDMADGNEDAIQSAIDMLGERGVEVNKENVARVLKQYPELQQGGLRRLMNTIGGMLPNSSVPRP